MRRLESCSISISLFFLSRLDSIKNFVNFILVCYASIRIRSKTIWPMFDSPINLFSNVWLINNNLRIHLLNINVLDRIRQHLSIVFHWIINRQSQSKILLLMTAKINNVFLLIAIRIDFLVNRNRSHTIHRTVNERLTIAKNSSPIRNCPIHRKKTIYFWFMSIHRTVFYNLLLLSSAACVKEFFVLEHWYNRVNV